MKMYHFFVGWDMEFFVGWDMGFFVGWDMGYIPLSGTRPKTDISVPLISKAQNVS